MTWQVAFSPTILGLYRSTQHLWSNGASFPHVPRASRNLTKRVRRTGRGGVRSRTGESRTALHCPAAARAAARVHGYRVFRGRHNDRQTSFVLPPKTIHYQTMGEVDSGFVSEYNGLAGLSTGHRACDCTVPHLPHLAFDADAERPNDSAGPELRCLKNTTPSANGENTAETITQEQCHTP
jgi:hypothetical protein